MDDERARIIALFFDECADGRAGAARAIDLGAVSVVADLPCLMRRGAA